MKLLPITLSFFMILVCCKKSEVSNGSNEIITIETLDGTLLMEGDCKIGTQVVGDKELLFVKVEQVSRLERILAENSMKKVNIKVGKKHFSHVLLDQSLDEGLLILESPHVKNTKQSQRKKEGYSTFEESEKSIEEQLDKWNREATKKESPFVPPVRIPKR